MHHHDPHHDHRDSCGCGHDHGAGCGHDHDHGHDHGDRCGCGHDHGEDIRVESRLHDTACVVSGSLALRGDYDGVRAALEACLGELAAAITARGGIVGHIKASAESVSVEMFSVTEVDVSVKRAPVQDIRISLAAIVFAIDRQVAEGLTRAALEAVKNSV